MFGFADDYFVWKHLGERKLINDISSSQYLHSSSQLELEYDIPYQQMI